MGQQQLLLVILVTIIVGIATVVAINTFSSAADSANLDAVRQDMLSMASSAQQYYMKPEALGGGGNKFDGISMDNLGGVPGTVESDGDLINQNGTYQLSSTSGQSFTITAAPASADGYTEGDISSVAAADQITAGVGPDNIDMGGDASSVGS